MSPDVPVTISQLRCTVSLGPPLQVMALLMGRMVETSMTRAVKLGRPTATTGGFILSASRHTYDVESEEEEGKSDLGMNAGICSGAGPPLSGATQ